ncbi:MAG: Transcriptional regulator, contains XRE-family HTH domain [Glomeribacter sp. 1016415]|nr:Transcriptional regulator, contains XRE-family HTH domain [Glomeribacter sp. 1016415]
METLAKRLTWARHQKKMPQVILARLVGVTQSAIGNLETGARLSSRHTAKIAAVLGVDALWLSEGTGQPYPGGVGKRAAQDTFIEGQSLAELWQVDAALRQSAAAVAKAQTLIREYIVARESCAAFVLPKLDIGTGVEKDSILSEAHDSSGDTRKRGQGK